MDRQVSVHHISGEEMAQGYTMGSRQDDGCTVKVHGNVLVRHMPLT